MIELVGAVLGIITGLLTLYEFIQRRRAGGSPMPVSTPVIQAPTPLPLRSISLTPLAIRGRTSIYWRGVLLMPFPIALYIAALSTESEESSPGFIFGMIGSLCFALVIWTRMLRLALSPPQIALDHCAISATVTGQKWVLPAEEVCEVSTRFSWRYGTCLLARIEDAERFGLRAYSVLLRQGRPGIDDRLNGVILIRAPEAQGGRRQLRAVANSYQRFIDSMRATESASTHK